jgi:hypothetical protein
MGLDTYLFKSKKIKDEKEKLIIFLEDEKPKYEEIGYWRKNYELVEIFGKVLGVIIENCEDYEVTKEQLEEIFKITKDETLAEAIKKVNWEDEIVIFHNWW